MFLHSSMTDCLVQGRGEEGKGRVEILIRHYVWLREGRGRLSFSCLVHKERGRVLKINLLFYTYNFKFQNIINRDISVILVEMFQILFPFPPNHPNIGGEQKLDDEGFCSPLIPS